MQVCSVCRVNKVNSEFNGEGDKRDTICKSCNTQEDGLEPVLPTELITKDVTVVPEVVDPREQKEITMKRMLAGAKARARDRGLPFNLHYDDVAIPNLCPVLMIPLIPSSAGHSDNSPSLDRMVPYLGYTKGNVKVISMKANRIKTDANSTEIELVLSYVKSIEKENI